MYTVLLFYIFTIDVNIDNITSIVGCQYSSCHFEDKPKKGNGVGPTLFKGKQIASLLTDFPDPEPKKVIRYTTMLCLIHI